MRVPTILCHVDQRSASRTLPGIVLCEVPWQRHDINGYQLGKCDHQDEVDMYEKQCVPPAITCPLNDPYKGEGMRYRRQHSSET